MLQQKFHVKKGDNVIVIAGKDKGKSGEVTSVDRSSQRVFVRGVNIVTKHKRASANTQGGIIQEEGSIHISNVMHIDPKDNKPTRIGYKTDKNNKKIRFSKRTGESIDK